MLNWIWMGLLTIGIIVGGLDGAEGIKRITSAAIDYAQVAVDISLGLIAVMTLWLGIMAIMEKAGFIQGLAKLLSPIMTRLFPDVPADHPAMGAMIMNLSANMLGVGNAATPFGLTAMKELQKLNPYKKTASNAMVTFLALNTACIQLVAANVVAVRAAAGSQNPTSFVGAALLTSLCGISVAVICAKLFQNLPMFRINPEDDQRLVAEDTANE